MNIIFYIIFRTRNTKGGLEAKVLSWQKAPTFGPHVSKSIKAAAHNLKEHPRENDESYIKCKHYHNGIMYPEVFHLSLKNCLEVCSQGPIQQC